MTQGPPEPPDDDEPTQPYPGASEPLPGQEPWQPPSSEQPSGQQPPTAYPDQPTYGQPTYEQPAYGQPTYGQPGYGQPTYGQPGYGQPAYGVPGVPYGAGPYTPYGVHPATGVPFSDKQKVVAGVLQIVIPLGIGRMYIGDTGVGVAQLLVTIFTCGLGALWPFIDGILILVADDKTDAQGRLLR